MAAVPAGLATALQDRYRFDREIGQGGMATVYLAEDLKHQRKVAVKVLRPDLAATLGSDRFIREITIAARLSHPHILPLHDSGEAGGFLYYVMPYVEGQSLREKLFRDGELPIPAAVRILAEVADAMAYAHHQGVVHRDIKPENVMLAERHAMVTDFGVAKAVSEATGRQTLTTAGVALGTPAYMAPEQAAADPHTDHRADIYAFGVLAYELLTGRPPFIGATPQSILAAHVTMAADPVTRYRATIPPTLAALVMKCLEKRPADRWQTMDELIPQLELVLTPSGGTMPTGARVTAPTWSSRQAWRRPGVAVTAAVLAVAVAIALWKGFRRPDAGELDANVIAVAPFDVLVPQLNVWREGMVDLLSRNLDGAGPLRTVAPTVVIRQWGGRADLPTALALGQATRAGLVVYGSLIPLGGDSVQIRGGLLDAKEARLLHEFQISGNAERVVQLSDSASVVLLQALGRIRSIGSTRYASLGSRSPPALKEFLAAEQYYRRTDWDSAKVHYERATTLDTSFALAWSRLGTIAGWQSTYTDSLEGVYFLRAGRLNHGLAPRDSLLLASDSASAALNDAPSSARAWSWRKRIVATLEEATQRYPDEPAAWYGLGEARYHYAIGPGLPPGRMATLDAFERAIRLDSAFAPAYIHCMELATELGGAHAAEPYFQAYFRLNPRDQFADGLRLAQALLDPHRRGSPEVRRVMDTMSADGLFATYWPLFSSTDTAAPILPVATAIGTGRRGLSPMWRDLDGRRWFRAIPLVQRGRYREAVTAVGDASRWVIGLATLAGAAPADSGAAVFRQMLAARNVGTLGYSGGPAFWAAIGDTGSLRTLSRTLDSMTRADTGLHRTAFLSAYSQQAQADLALARRDTLEAARRFAMLSDTLCPTCEWAHLQQARVLAAVKRDREAADVLDAGTDSYSPYYVWFELERARIAERLGERERAVRGFQTVAAYWAKADPELQPLVNESRQALSRLSAER
jgi:serine/threonine-protein kinase